MRIVQVVCSPSFTGVERYVAGVAGELTVRGHQVVVVGGDPERMRAELPSGSVIRPGPSVPAAMAGLWRTGRCDIVHAHMTDAEFVATVLKRRTRGRLVVTRHFTTARGRSVAGRLARPFIRRAVDRQIAISEFVATAIGEPSIVIHNGVTATRGSAARSRTVLMLQRLEAEKDTATGIRAWAASGLADAGWRLDVCGSGSQVTQLRELAGSLGVAGSVAFAGQVDDPRGRLASAAMLLATTPGEAFGLSVVEAMAEGTPVLAAAGGGHLETLGPDGHYFPPGDAASCAAGLRELASDTSLRERYGATLRQRQQQCFTIARSVDELLAQYERLLRP